MSWLEEAQKLAAQKEKQSDTPFSCSSESERENIKKKLRQLYENATEREIDKAIDQALDALEKPYTEKAFLTFLRIKLED